jgi:ubiquinone/menaquinone biosynthesis C-methylase UbiE
MTDSTKRFSDRVDYYLKYRPKYPQVIITTLQKECALAGKSVIADIGSGTGFLAELFLENGNQVFGVEPNAGMRAGAEQYLADYPNFTSVDGTAENTSLKSNRSDFVTAAQAFHWFDIEKCRVEFKRILKADGFVALIWHERDKTDPFLQDYEQALKSHSKDYGASHHKNITPEILRTFYGHDDFKHFIFEYTQHFDLEGLHGRALSASYVPAPGEPGNTELMDRLSELFEQYEKAGQVSFRYQTQMYYGRL